MFQDTPSYLNVGYWNKDFNIYRQMVILIDTFKTLFLNFVYYGESVNIDFWYDGLIEKGGLKRDK